MADTVNGAPCHAWHAFLSEQQHHLTNPAICVPGIFCCLVVVAAAGEGGCTPYNPFALIAIHLHSLRLQVAILHL